MTSHVVDLCTSFYIKEDSYGRILERGRLFFFFFYKAKGFWQAAYQFRHSLLSPLRVDGVGVGAGGRRLPGCGCAAATVPARGEEAGPGPVGAGSAKQPRELLLVVTKQLLLDVVFKNVQVLSSEMPFFFFF